jgi:glycosyltransferase involved in cell wall biosynthesis
MVSPHRLSIIIPAYNAEDYIPETLDSILSQTFTDYEIIVVNDGSTDATQDVLTPYIDKIHYVYQDNTGVSEARNHGLRLAKGEFVIFVDADDYFIAADKLERQIAVFDANPNLDIVQTGWRMVDSDGNFLFDMTPWEDMVGSALKEWFMWCPVRLEAMMVRRECAGKVGGFDPKYKVSQDLDWALKMILVGCRFQWQERIASAYRQHGSSLTHSNRLKLVDDTVLVTEDLLNRDNLPYELRYHNNRIRYYRYIWAIGECYLFGLVDDMQRYMRKSIPYASKDILLVMFDWLGEIVKRLHEKGLPVSQIREIFPLCRDTAQIGETISFDGERQVKVQVALEWWLDVLLPFQLEQSENISEDILGQFHTFSVRDIVKITQSALLVAPIFPTGEDVDKLWDMLLNHGLIADAEKQEVTTLYLTIMTRTIFARHWRLLPSAIGSVFKSGIHPRAIPAWSRFIKSILRYLALRLHLVKV